MYVESLVNMACEVLSEEEGCTRYEKSKTLKNGPSSPTPTWRGKWFAKLGSSSLTMVSSFPHSKYSHCLHSRSEDAIACE